jgi:hypothetical protein
VNEVAVRTVVLEGCPLDLFDRTRQHNEALMREFAIIAGAGDDSESSTAPAQVLGLVDRIRAHLTSLNAVIDEQLDQARSHGQRLVDLEVQLPAGGQDLVRSLARLIDEAEDYCRRGELLTLAESEEPRAFRAWCMQQYLEQLDGAAPTSWAAWRSVRR